MADQLLDQPLAPLVEIVEQRAGVGGEVVGDALRAAVDALEEGTAPLRRARRAGSAYRRRELVERIPFACGCRRRRAARCSACRASRAASVERVSSRLARSAWRACRVACSVSVRSFSISLVPVSVDCSELARSLKSLSSASSRSPKPWLISIIRLAIVSVRSCVRICSWSPSVCSRLSSAADISLWPSWKAAAISRVRATSVSLICRARVSSVELMRSSRSSSVLAKPSARCAKLCVTSPMRAVTRFSKPERRPSTAISMVLAEEASRMAAASALSERRLSKPVRRESSVSPICATRVSMSDPSAALRSPSVEARAPPRLSSTSEMRSMFASICRRELGAARGKRRRRVCRRSLAMTSFSAAISVVDARRGLAAGAFEAALRVAQRRLHDAHLLADMARDLAAGGAEPLVGERQRRLDRAELLDDVAGDPVAGIVEPVVGARQPALDALHLLVDVGGDAVAGRGEAVVGGGERRVDRADLAVDVADQLLGRAAERLARRVHRAFDALDLHADVERHVDAGLLEALVGGFRAPTFDDGRLCWPMSRRGDIERPAFWKRSTGANSSAALTASICRPMSPAILTPPSSSRSPALAPRLSMRSTWLPNASMTVSAVLPMRSFEEESAASTAPAWRLMSPMMRPPADASAVSTAPI